MGRASGPVLALFLIGALAIAGFPGTSGFIAKTLVKDALKEGHHTLAIQALLLAGLGTTLSFSKLAWYGFLGGPAYTGQSPPVIRRADPRCLAAMAFLAAATLLLGILPVIHPDLLRGHAPPWLSLSTLFPALPPILGGVACFSLFPGVFRPHQEDVPDLYCLLTQTRRPYLKLIGLMADLHNGRLRFYLFIVLGLAFLILSTLQLL